MLLNRRASSLGKKPFSCPFATLKIVKSFFVILLCFCLCLPAMARAKAKARAAGKAKVSAARSSKSKGKVRATRSTLRAGKGSRRDRRGRLRFAGRERVVREHVPQRPSADRIREIQQALIAKGFLQSEATGDWDSSTVEAWKKLEADNNLKVDGRIDSLGLIAIGLGPQSNNARESSAP
jgi:hypothetical protein